MKLQMNINEKLRVFVSWMIILIIMGFALFALSILVKMGFREGQYSEFYFTVIRDHFRVIVGLPMAAVAALFIVLLLRSTQGPIEFEAVGLKFRGASGPITLWLLCFIGITLAIKLLW
jgi:hypothetical protein